SKWLAKPSVFLVTRKFTKGGGPAPYGADQRTGHPGRFFRADNSARPGPAGGAVGAPATPHGGRVRCRGLLLAPPPAGEHRLILSSPAQTGWGAQDTRE